MNPTRLNKLYQTIIAVCGGAAARAYALAVAAFSATYLMLVIGTKSAVATLDTAINAVFESWIPIVLTLLLLGLALGFLIKFSKGSHS